MNGIASGLVRNGLSLYARWTQFGVFSSHLRYHGTSPREPYEFPAVADIVRLWWHCVTR